MLLKEVGNYGSKSKLIRLKVKTYGPKLVFGIFPWIFHWISKMQILQGKNAENRHLRQQIFFKIKLNIGILQIFVVLGSSLQFSASPNALVSSSTLNRLWLIVNYLTMLSMAWQLSHPNWRVTKLVVKRLHKVSSGSKLRIHQSGIRWRDGSWMESWYSRMKSFSWKQKTPVLDLIT